MREMDGIVYRSLTLYLDIETHRRAKLAGLNITAAARSGVMQALEELENEKNTGNPELSTARGRRATN